MGDGVHLLSLANTKHHQVAFAVPVKCEHLHPGGSLEARIAIVDDAEASGTLRPLPDAWDRYRAKAGIQGWA